LPTRQDILDQWQENCPVAAIIFYRALLQSGDLRPVDALINRLRAQGLNPLPIFVSSLKDASCAEWVQSALDESGADVILNLTGFAVSSPGADSHHTPFTDADCPVLQVILSGGTDEDGNSYTSLERWREFGAMAAVAADNLFIIPASPISRPTPRLLEGARTICEKLDVARAQLQKQ